MAQNPNDNVDGKTPVLVGIGVSQQRFEDPAEAAQVYQLMTEAVETAAVDAGSEHLLADADVIYVPEGIWKYSDPARLIAEDIGAAKAKTVFAEIGILQQSLIGDACRRIAAGELDIAIVAGGEAKYRDLRSKITGVELSDLEQVGVEPDTKLSPAAEIWSQIEANAGLGMPVGFYAILESALRHARGQSVEDHRDQVAAMYEGFSRVAVANPNAWNRQPVSAAQIRNPGDKNKMLAFPYTKYHNSQWNVDQAAGLIFCSVEKARELKIPEHKWVFPLASTESNHMVNASQRRELHGSPGARIAGKRALAAGDVTVEQLDYLEMYSCFPSAVQIYARELNIDLSQELTVTGGMTFGGGPLNNYVLQSTCRMAELLREDPGTVGLVTSVSGMLTKQGFGLWSSQAGSKGFEYADVTEEVSAADEVLELVDGCEGEATIAGYTVLFNGDDPARGVAVCDLPDGKRTVVFSEDAQAMARMMVEDLCGVAVTLQDNQFSF